jgi:hypothetical protein
MDCVNCGFSFCDGLDNCERCGEDTKCGKALCDDCETQDRIDEMSQYL